MFLVTGGSSGIGEALAKQLAQRDQSVLICGRRQAQLVQTQDEFPELIEYVAGDITQQKTINAIVEQIGGRKIFGLVQNAGQITPMLPITEMPIEGFRSLNALNLEAPIVLFQALHSQLAGGRVLHLSSLMAHVPAHSWGAYCISKAGLFMLYQVLKKECPETAFGSVMPGVTDTDMQALIREAAAMPEAERAFFQNLHQSQQLLAPEVVGQFLAWLLLDVSTAQFSAQEWDIYKTEHHQHWLKQGVCPAI